MTGPADVASAQDVAGHAGDGEVRGGRVGELVLALLHVHNADVVAPRLAGQPSSGLNGHDAAVCAQTDAAAEENHRDVAGRRPPALPVAPEREDALPLE